MHRNTYVETNGNNITYNVNQVIKRYNEYKYYIGVVKANCYGHGLDAVKYIIDGGCNYLAVATLDEALEIRKKYNDINIMCLGLIPSNSVGICAKECIDITCDSLEYLKSIDKNILKELKIHIKINTGMNRIGLNRKEELNNIFNYIKEANSHIQGIFTHIYDAQNTEHTLKQYELFEQITEDIDLSSVPMVHIKASDALVNYPKRNYETAVRLGIVMYGLTSSDIALKDTFCLKSQVIKINEIENETVGYSGIYRAGKREKIAVIPIGYADGIIRKNTGRYVYINDRKYQIVGNVCMDMLFVKVDDNVKEGDTVYVIKDNKHILEIAKHLETIPYEVICQVGIRVNRIIV